MIHEEPMVPEATERLVFRRMSHDDIDDMAALMGSPEVMTYYPRTKTRAEAHDWIEWNLRGYAKDGFGLWLLHDHDGNFVGECGLTWQIVEAESRLEVGYHVMPHHQGTGLATEAAAATKDLARARGIERLIAIVHHENRPSQRVAEKLGMTVEKQITSAFGVPTLVYATDL